MNIKLLKKELHKEMKHKWKCHMKWNIGQIPEEITEK